MKKLMLLTVVGIAYSLNASTQVNTKKELQAVISDTEIKSNLSTQSIDIKGTAKNPVHSFKDLFETDGPGFTENSGPRLNPRAVSFVQDYIIRYGNSLSKMKEWGRPFFNMMDGIFVSKNLPRELKYLAVIESRLNPVSVSWAGAVGPWQFMPATAARMGLKVNRYVDERTNYIKSTQAAAKYLTELYNQFGDWLLVIAAYNGGPGNVLKAIRRAGSRNFWDIQYYLPTESRNHVKKFIGTHYVFEGQGGLTTLTRAEADDHYGSDGNFLLTRNLDNVETANSKDHTISGKFNSLVIAKNVQMDISEFNRYNPQFDKLMATNNTYELKLPAEKMELFLAHKYLILSESIQLLLNNAALTGEGPQSSFNKSRLAEK